MTDEETKNEVYYQTYGRIVGVVERFQGNITDLLYHIKVVDDHDMHVELGRILTALESIQAKSMKISRFKGRVVDTPDGLYRLPRDKDVPEPLRQSLTYGSFEKEE